MIILQLFFIKPSSDDKEDQTLSFHEGYTCFYSIAFISVLIDLIH